MSNLLLDYFAQFGSLSAEETAALEDSMLIKAFEKDSFILKEGQNKAYSYFVMEGLVRAYKLIDGEEVTTNFYTEGQWIISLNSFVEDKLANENLICLEDTNVVIGNEQRAQTLFQSFPRFETIARAVMEQVFREQLAILSTYHTNSPEERYLKLVNTRPELLQRVPQYQIASYIGVKAESLSRIRKRIAKQL